MKAICIHQPWAWLIVSGIKDVENRGWATSYRGPLLIHAGKHSDREAMEMISQWAEEDGFKAPAPADLHTGGIVGVATLIDVVCDSRSIWAGRGKKHWVLSDARRLPFVPWKGQQGLFDIPYDLDLERIAA